MIADVENAIREYLPNVLHMSLATSELDQPWVSELHFVFDENLNLYFRSTESRRHSEEISKNSKVAGNIIKQHNIGEKVRGVYFEGTAMLLGNVDQDHIAYKLYCQRFNTNEAILDDAKLENGHKFYKIVVKEFYLFDSIESTPSQKYSLPWKKN